MHHDEVADEVVERVRQRVLDGMGLDRPPLGALLENLSAPDGHDLQS